MTPALFHLLYVSNFIKRRFGSLFGPNFGLHRIPIWSQFHPNLGPYLYAHRSLSVYQHLPTAQHLIFIHLSINSTIHPYIHPSIYLSFHPSTHPSNHPAPTHLSIQGSTAVLSGTSGPFNTTAGPGYNLIFNGNHFVTSHRTGFWLFSILKHVIQVRHPFERLVSAYQSKVVRSTDEWYFLVFVLNDTF